MCAALLGKIGGPIALLGVIVCPITSGDTAFRSARMTIFDWFKLDEKNIRVRLSAAIPLLLIGYAISFANYNVVWRYTSWSNQALAMIVLWAGSVYLATNYENKNRCWIAVLPAAFMTEVSITYLFYAPECFNLGARGETGLTISYAAGILVALVCLAIFLLTAYRNPKASLERQKKIVIGRK